jgi:hypothetical protein
MTLQELLDHVKKLDAEGTKGPWWNEDGDICCYPEEWSAGHIGCVRPGTFEEHNNAEFAAESRQLLPVLAKIVEAMREEVSRWGGSYQNEKELTAVANRIIKEAGL